MFLFILGTHAWPGQHCIRISLTIYRSVGTINMLVIMDSGETINMTRRQGDDGVAAASTRFLTLLETCL